MTTPFGSASFVTHKWAYDRAARVRSKRAHRIIEHAVTRIVDTRPEWDSWCDDPALRDAITILRGAAMRVNEAEDAAHKAAALVSA